ncbi:MAG: 50S ribosomal protein L3 [Planctomycetes bacterium]|nr:50S ribosomal protein L3 [Planctomycetota bacterium]
MRLGILGKKIGMTRVLDERGQVEPVTVVQAGPCVVLQVKTRETDGYDAVQLGFEDCKPHRSTLPLIGHAAKAGTGPKRFVREIRLDAPAEVACGDVVTVQQFADAGVSFVDVAGTTKGCGFTGVMKRWGFGGKEASHGVERKHRSAGSIGGHADTGTGRGVKKGKRMAGQSGNVRRTVMSVRLLKVDLENDLMLIRGSIPGPAGSWVEVRQAKKKG